ncbi:MAG TPA: DUF998 domain-containing protein [Acidimicrobiales bacterium]|nr:DUF998 domain-containing protein [Acidimicrobiales bacterium]
MTSTAVLAGAVSLAGTATAVGALGYLHLAPTGLSPLRNPVSQYGITRYRAGYRVLTISMGVAGTAIATALATLPSSFDEVVVLLAIFATCRYAISWFPMDAPGTPPTSTGRAHGLLAVVTFGSIAVAAIRLFKQLEVDPHLDTLASTSRILGWLMVTCFALLFFARLAPDLRRYFGASERALYVAILVWLVVLGIACATGHLSGTSIRVLFGGAR